jgi:hypothetical protein
VRVCDVKGKGMKVCGGRREGKGNHWEGTSFFD